MIKKEERGTAYRDLSLYSKEELLSFIVEIKKILAEKYHASETEIHEKTSEDGVPVEVFSTDLSPSEATVKWLKEQGLGYHEIGLKLHRDERGLWSGYRRASHKMSMPFVIEHSQTIIPFSVLGNRSTSMLESVVFYLKETKQVKLIAIAHMLHKHPSTIWTVYNRARTKQRGAS